VSDVAKGAKRVGSAMTQFSKLGYRCARISASGQRRGKRREEKGLDGDFIAFAPDESTYPHVIVESGGRGKSVTESIREMTEHGLPPGFVPIVARCVGRGVFAWRWHTRSGARGFKTLLAALEDAKAA